MNIKESILEKDSFLKTVYIQGGIAAISFFFVFVQSSLIASISSKNFVHAIEASSPTVVSQDALSVTTS